MQPALLEIASAVSSSDVATLVARELARRDVVLARVWLVREGGLQLAGSAGAPTGGGSYSRVDGAFSRIAFGEGKIGGIADSRASLIVANLRGDEEWLANPAWISRQGVRAFVGHPMVANDEVLGVLAAFDRAKPSIDTLAAWEFLARYAAMRLSQIRERDGLVARVHALESAAERPLDSSPAQPGSAATGEPHHILTRGELRALERETLEAALMQTTGRIFGPQGAARLLRMKPTTLASRMKALGIPPARVMSRRLKSHG